LRAYHLVIFLLFTGYASYAQQITGVWKGRINGKTVELKIIQKGDSLVGTSYYTGLTRASFRRYSIKGYFDANTKSVVWWDDELISSKANTTDRPFMSVADFNCPGGGRMFLNGKSGDKDEQEDPRGSVNLTKVERSSVKDEWDFVLDHFGEGGNDPEIIDSISKIAFAHAPVPERVIPPKPMPVEQPVVIAAPVKKDPPTVKVEKPQTPKPTPPSIPAVVQAPPVKKEIPPVVIAEKKLPPRPLTTDEMFTSRKKVFNKEIALSGDSIELRFYDNAEVDGDSISLYLNDKLIFTHIRLTANAYTILLPVKDLNENNELVMVAENLGSIPPNTAFMVAIVGDKRHEAHLESTENSSCLIRLRKLP
jgi:hypothetical protein